MVDILIVDDDPNDRAIINRAVRRRSPALVTKEIEDGEQALDYLLRRGEFACLVHEDLPRLVITDCNLPSTTGIELLREVKLHEACCQVPVLMLTASDSKADRIAALDAGAREFLVKPARYENYMTLLQRVFSEWLEDSQARLTD